MLKQPSINDMVLQILPSVYKIKTSNERMSLSG